MADIPGYAGKLLYVDLSAGTTEAKDLDPMMARDYIGGRALGVKLLWDAYGENWADIDPLAPEAVLCLLPGPLSCFAASKSMAVFKSPLSNGAMGSRRRAFLFSKTLSSKRKYLDSAFTMTSFQSSTSTTVRPRHVKFSPSFMRLRICCYTRTQ